MAVLRGVGRPNEENIVDKPQATRAMAWGVASEHYVDCSNIIVL